MRRPTLVLVLALALLVPLGLVACGGGEEVSPTPETVEGTLPEDTTEESPGSTLEGDAAAGEEVYNANGCGGCHALEAAGTTGTVGPNLDDSKPDKELVVDRVTNGRGAMPAFKDQYSAEQIEAVADYVVSSTGG